MSESPGKSGLLAAAEFVKYSTGLGAGALVFSAGLAKESALPQNAACWLIASWSALTLAVIAGVIAYSRIPVMLAKEKYDLQDDWFRIPGMIHEVFFVIGIAFLGIALVRCIW